MSAVLSEIVAFLQSMFVAIVVIFLVSGWEGVPSETYFDQFIYWGLGLWIGGMFYRRGWTKP